MVRLICGLSRKGGAVKNGADRFLDLPYTNAIGRVARRLGLVEKPRFLIRQLHTDKQVRIEEVV